MKANDFLQQSAASTKMGNSGHLFSLWSENGRSSCHLHPVSNLSKNLFPKNFPVGKTSGIVPLNDLDNQETSLTLLIAGTKKNILPHPDISTLLTPACLSHRNHHYFPDKVLNGYFVCLFGIFFFFTFSSPGCS